MKKLKLYLDTSIWNFIFADDAPEKKEITLRFFEQIQFFAIFISGIVLEEIAQADTEKRMKLENVLFKYKPAVLEVNSEVMRLSKLYIERGVIPMKKDDDAQHIAFSTYYEMDILLSWNYKHLANVFKKRKIQIINLEEGYDKPLELITPMEVINEDSN
ncbi:MAG: hypothetical protein A2096_11230 [Spirochaetes bacterium GWF1_41_5]|nr:MAG: hypothetical protein A2096_11230 [Spirochaetes bacterium GWF1_41_5]HBE04133.1 hypothetical protein [Spirochaetia bacterium]